MCTGSCGGYILDGITNGLGRKAPDFAFVYRIVRWAIDLIDAPVVSRAEIKAYRIIAAGTQCDAANAVVDIVEILTKVNFVSVDCRRKIARRPAQNHIS
ncbi:hypothetical protein ES703_82604 [subsurface metagenome]